MGIAVVADVRVSAVKWDPDSALLGVLLCESTWIAIWNSVTKQMVQLNVDECEDTITAFAWSHSGKLLLGMANGDIHIKDMAQQDRVSPGFEVTIRQKMLGSIGICDWSDAFGIVVHDSDIAVTNELGLTVERITSNDSIDDV